MEDFVPFELAVKLKEKGLKTENTAYCYLDGDLVQVKKYINISPYEYAPTISQVLKWLREEKCIDITILPVFVDYYKREYKVKIYATCLGEPYDSEYFHSYEKAELFAINYAIDNLI